MGRRHHRPPQTNKHHHKKKKRRRKKKEKTRSRFAKKVNRSSETVETVADCTVWQVIRGWLSSIHSPTSGVQDDTWKSAAEPPPLRQRVRVIRGKGIQEPQAERVRMFSAWILVREVNTLWTWNLLEKLVDICFNRTPFSTRGGRGGGGGAGGEGGGWNIGKLGGWVDPRMRKLDPSAT